MERHGRLLEQIVCDQVVIFRQSDSSSMVEDEFGAGTEPIGQENREYYQVGNEEVWAGQ
jgi:hypothetical protein